MPQAETTVTSTEKVHVALDATGAQLKIGDYVTIKLMVHRIDLVYDPETGKESHQMVALCEVRESGYKAPFCTVDSRLCNKVD